MRHQSAVASVATAILLAACQRQHEPAPAPIAEGVTPPPAATAAAPVPTGQDEAPPPGVLRAYVWDCGGDLLKARNLWRENAIAVDLHDGTHRLNSVPSASGARYSDGVVTLFTKGGAATLETPGQPAVQCRELRAASLLEDARVRGVLYRGSGNEPGWTLEIGPGNALVWVTAYGQERHEYANALVSGAATTGFVYTATDATGEIRVTVSQAPCQDDMSGDTLDHQFVLVANGAQLRGCGSRVQP